MNNTRLVRLVVDRLAVGAMAEPAIDITIDRCLHEPDRAVAEGEIGSVETVLTAETTDESGRNPDRAGVDQLFNGAGVLVITEEKRRVGELDAQQRGVNPV